jgi:hypothetical protein
MLRVLIEQIKAMMVATLEAVARLEAAVARREATAEGPTKPESAAVISPNSADIRILSLLPQLTDIVMAGSQVQFQVPLTSTGWAGVATYANEQVRITHHLEEVR